MMNNLSHTNASYFMCFQVVVPRSAFKAKGLLLSCIMDKNPCLVLEPKVLYRNAEDEIPSDKYFLPIGKADIVQKGAINFSIIIRSLTVTTICW